MRRTRVRIALVSAGFLLLLLSAVGWVSLTVLDLQRSERTMRAQATVEENVRLALWRMDSAIAPIIAREGMLPATDFLGPMVPGEFVRLNFQFDPAGALSSPQSEGESLAAFARLVSHEQISTALAAERYSQEILMVAANNDSLPAIAADDASLLSLEKDDGTAGEQLAQLQKSSNEYMQRSWTVGNVYTNSFANPVHQIVSESDGLESGPFTDEPDGYMDGHLDASTDGKLDGGKDAGLARQLARRASFQAAAAHPMTPLWIGDELLLARRVQIAGREWIQGSWFNWSGLRGQLLSSIGDLLPNAELVSQPVAARSAQVDPARTLVSLPTRLVAGTLASMPDSHTPVGWILLVVWCAVLLAAGAAVALIVGVSALSERRAAFVAAVTHELRTPLTTLQTYSEMLADGKVRDAGKQARYVRTLHREAVRLGHLVENVLSYSRIERGRTGLRADPVPVHKFLERAEQRLRERAAGAGMDLDVQSPAGEGVTFIGDESAVEQIVFNLVDNASKYASKNASKYESGGPTERIEVGARASATWVEIHVRDWGPGVPADVRKRLFQPFSKSVERAATTAPGVGLGLALSRRLARSMGGQLHLDPDIQDGSRFVLRLPLERQ